MTGIPSKEELDQAKDSRFSPEIHRKLKEASVGIAGLGGLGSHIAVMLARSGMMQGDIRSDCASLRGLTERPI